MEGKKQPIENLLGEMKKVKKERVIQYNNILFAGETRTEYMARTRKEKIKSFLEIYG